MADTKRRRRFWGWGYEDVGVEPNLLAFVEASLSALFGGSAVRRTPPTEGALRLPTPRVTLPSTLAQLTTSAPFERACHALGRSTFDLIRAIEGDFSSAPDLVAYPETEADIANLLCACSERRIAVIPFGGGTSVSGGVEPRVSATYAGTLSLDLSRLSGVLEVDETNRAARILGGTSGPDLEEALRKTGHTLRFFPQSFELATLGGWIATRAGGHFATGPTHIDDLVQSVRMIAPRGPFETRRLPGSGAGPAPERLAIGSEGILGIITEAWLRIVKRPVHRNAQTFRFDNIGKAVVAQRALLQAGFQPANARVLDPAEVLITRTAQSDGALLLLAFEAAERDVSVKFEAACELLRGAGGAPLPSAGRAERDETADQYKSVFLRGPYLRDELLLRGAFVETYETAVLYSRFEELYERVHQRVAALDLGPHMLSCRVTHAYRDGCAPYFTLIARPKDIDPGGRALWQQAKEAITGAFLDAGGTTTHHHAVGRDLVPHYERERPDLFATMLRAAKREVDPAAVLNPGVLLPEAGESQR